MQQGQGHKKQQDMNSIHEAPRTMIERWRIFRRYVFLGIFRWLSCCRYHKRREVFLLFSVHSFDFRNESGPIVEPKHFTVCSPIVTVRVGTAVLQSQRHPVGVRYLSCHAQKRSPCFQIWNFFPYFMYVIVLFIYYCVLVWFKQVIHSPIQTSIAKLTGHP